MIIKDINNKDLWENFLEKNERRTFINSWNWGNFRNSLENKIWRKGVFENEELIAIYLISKIISKKGNFLLLNHCPVLKDDYSEKILPQIINNIKEIATKEKVSFIRIAPLWENELQKNLILRKYKFRNSSSFIFPERSWELSLKESEEEILNNMRKGTRYMIKKGIKENDLSVKISHNIEDLDIFYKIYKNTAKSQNFSPFSFNYLKKEFESFQNDNQVSLFLAYYKEHPIAGAFVIFWKNVAFYHHGASLLEYKNIPASYLVQWEIIKEAKKRNCDKYNFWVISPDDNQNHRWYGLSFFKKGFGGKEIKYAKTLDLPLSLNYWITFAFEKIKR